MNPFDHARKIVTIDCPGRQVFVVSLANDSYRMPFTVTPSSQTADHVALITRQIIAGEIAEALKNEDCRLAAEIDQAYFKNEIWHIQHAASLCRRLAELHAMDCIRQRAAEIGQSAQKNRQQPSGNSESAAPGGRNG
jgi:hypothetical protein